MHQRPASPGRGSFRGDSKRKGSEGAPGKAAEFVTQQLTPSRCNSEEGVAHNAHRLWDPSKIPPVDLWTTHLFYFFQNPPTERLACSERYRAKAIVTDVSKVNRALRSPAPLISRAHDSSPSRRPRAGSLVPRRSCAGSANGSGKGFPVTDRRRLAHLRIERAMRARPGLLASRPNYRPANEISGVCPLDAKRAEQVRVRSRLVALTFRVVTYGRSRNAASLKLSRLNASPPAQPALL